MPNGPFIEKWDIQMNAYLKELKARSKSMFD
jgi:hypothetical protein